MKTALLLMLVLASTVSADLIGYWPLDETSGTIAYDSSGYGQNGVAYNVAASYGVLGGAYYLNDVNGRVNVTLTPLLASPVSNVSVNMWVKRSTQNNVLPILLDYASQAEQRGMLIYLNPLTPGVDLMNASGSAVRCSLTASTAYNLPLDTWTMITAVYALPNLTIYVNGALAKSKGCNTNNIVYGTNKPLIFGDYTTHTLDKFNGSMDDVMIFNHSLTASQVSALYSRRLLNGTKPYRDVMTGDLLNAPWNFWMTLFPPQIMYLPLVALIMVMGFIVYYKTRTIIVPAMMLLIFLASAGSILAGYLGIVGLIVMGVIALAFLVAILKIFW